LLRAKSAKFSENLNLYTQFKFSTFKDHITSSILYSQVTNNSRMFSGTFIKERGTIWLYVYIIDIHSLWGLSLTGVIWKTIVDAWSTEAFRERLANIQPDYLFSLELARHLLSH